MKARRVALTLAALLCIGAVRGQAAPPAAASKGGYVTPAPTYPPQSRAVGIEGTGTVQVTFDAQGRPTAVSMVVSTGSYSLDRRTVLFVQKNWAGPVGRALTKKVIVEYKAPPRPHRTRQPPMRPATRFAT